MVNCLLEQEGVAAAKCDHPEALTVADLRAAAAGQAAESSELDSYPSSDGCLCIGSSVERSVEVQDQDMAVLQMNLSGGSGGLG